MKTCIFITGTNCVGKTSVVREIIARSGGVEELRKTITICKGRKIALAGPYRDGSNYGGVDALNETKGLEGIVRGAFEEGAEYVFCEGSYLNTFGINLTNAFFTAEKQLLVCLVAPLETINKRLGERTGSSINKKIVEKQQRAITAAIKFSQIGVPVMMINAEENTTAEIADQIIERL